MMKVTIKDTLTLQLISTDTNEEIFSLEKSSTDGLFIFHYNKFTTVISSLDFLDNTSVGDTELRLYRDNKLIGVLTMTSINSKLRKAIEKFTRVN